MRFVLQDKIGQGAMGTVYKAFDTETGETVAVKVLPARTASRDELKIARKITHPNVCRVFDLHAEGDRFFISMEFIDGETLRSYLDRLGRVSVDEMLRIGNEMMDGLEEAHRQGILHRDLKPENVMITRDGTAKLMDFGVAHFMDPKGVMATRLVGTPTHMSPEQLALKPADERSDIYSLALILYEMVNGRPAFDGDSTGELFQQHLVGSPAGVRQSIDLPGPIAVAILRCLEKEPSRRFASIEELRNGMTFGAGLGETPPAPKNRIGLVAAAAVAITLSALALTLPTTENAKPAPPVVTAPSKASPPLLPKPLDKSLPSIAIFPFVNLKGDPQFKSFERSIVENLTGAFVRSAQFRVVERSRLDELIATRPTQNPQEMGRIAGAQYVIFGSFRVLLSDFTIYAEIYSTETAEAVFTDTITGDLRDARTIEERFAGEMIAHLKAFKP